MALIVAVEGLPGAGKTTIIRMVMEDLRKLNYRVEVADIETGGHAPTLRRMTRTYPPGDPARILLFLVLRLHQDKMIRSHSGADIVFADRFWGSTVAYDIYGNRVPRKVVEWVDQHIEEQADMTIFFDAPIDVVRRRKEAKTMQDPAFARRVEQGYRDLAKAHSWIRVDASQEPERVKAACMKVILLRMES